MNLLQFMDKHIFFSFLVIVFLLVVIYSVWTNLCNMRIQMKSKRQREEGYEKATH